MAKRKLTARQVRWLFATGRLKASGKGKDRKVTYSKEGGSGKSRADRIAAGRTKADAFLGRQKRIEAGLKVRDDFLSKVKESRTFKPGGDYVNMKPSYRTQAAASILGRKVNPRSKTDSQRAVRQVERARDIRFETGRNSAARARVNRVNEAVATGQARRANPQLKQREQRIAAGRRAFAGFQASPRGRALKDAVQKNLTAGMAGDRYVRTVNAFGMNNAARADKRAFDKAKKDASTAARKARLTPEKLRRVTYYLGK